MSTYSVSYRNRWWKRRRFACGFVSWKEATETIAYLADAGYRDIRMERTAVLPVPEEET